MAMLNYRTVSLQQMNTDSQASLCTPLVIQDFAIEHGHRNSEIVVLPENGDVAHRFLFVY